MKKFRKLIAIGTCGLVMGITASVMTVPEAGARSYWCDQRIENMERQSAKDYAKGRLTEDEYLKIQEEIAFHRTLWGC